MVAVDQDAPAAGTTRPRDLTRSQQDRILPSETIDDLDAFRTALNGAYYPAFVDAPGPRPVLSDARMNAATLSRMTVGFVRFGHQAIVDPGRIDGYHVNVPVAGAIESICGPSGVVARRGTAAVFTPNGRTRLPRWSDDAAQLCIKIERTSLEHELEALSGRPVDRPVDFPIELDLTGDRGARWEAALMNLIDQIGEAPAPVVEYLERALISQLLLTARHSSSESIEDRGMRLAPRAVRDAAEHIRASADGVPLTAAQIAAHAGVGIRRLEQAFREHLGTSPMQLQRDTRLTRARHDLVDPTATATVSDVMHRWGFTNHARFAAAYRERFGESPADTLRLARR